MARKYKIGDTVTWSYDGRSGTSTILGYSPSDDSKYYVVGPPEGKDSSSYKSREAKNDSGELFTIPQGWNVEEGFMKLKKKSSLKYKIGDIVTWEQGCFTGTSKIIAYTKLESMYDYIIESSDGNKLSGIDETGEEVSISSGWHLSQKSIISKTNTDDIKSFKDLKYKIGDQVIYLGKVHTIVAYYADPASKVPPGYTISGIYGIHNGIGYSYDAQGNFIHSGLPDSLCRYVNESEVTPLPTPTSTISKSFEHLKYKIGDTVLYCNEPHTIVAYYKGQNIGYTISGPKGYHDAHDYSYDALGNKATLKGFTHIYVTEDRVSPLTSTYIESSLLDLGSTSPVIKCNTNAQKPAIHNIYTPNQTILKTKKHVNSKIVH